MEHPKHCTCQCLAWGNYFKIILVLIWLTQKSFIRLQKLNSPICLNKSEFKFHYIYPKTHFRFQIFLQFLTLNPCLRRARRTAVMNSRSLVHKFDPVERVTGNVIESTVGWTSRLKRRDIAGLNPRYRMSVSLNSVGDIKSLWPWLRTHSFRLPPLPLH